MTLTTSKILAGIVIFFLAFLAGLLPIRFAKAHKHLFSIGDAFAGGVFLSAALLHMLPSAQANFQESMPSTTYPIALLIIGLTFIFLFLLEHSTLLFSKKHFPNGLNTTPYVLTFLISVHSMLEGAAIGINSNLANMTIIFFAVLGHKGSEGFALSLNLHRYKVASSLIAVIILLFSLMTPLGIYITTQISNIVNNESGKLVIASLNALAAGTFLYLGTVHIIAEPDHIVCRCGILALLAGMALMAIVAIWV